MSVWFIRRWQLKSSRQVNIQDFLSEPFVPYRKAWNSLSKYLRQCPPTFKRNRPHFERVLQKLLCDLIGSTIDASEGESVFVMSWALHRRVRDPRKAKYVREFISERCKTILMPAAFCFHYLNINISDKLEISHGASVPFPIAPSLLSHLCYIILKVGRNSVIWQQISPLLRSRIIYENGYHPSLNTIRVHNLLCKKFSWEIYEPSLANIPCKETLLNDHACGLGFLCGFNTILITSLVGTNNTGRYSYQLQKYAYQAHSSS